MKALILKIWLGNMVGMYCQSFTQPTNNELYVDSQSSETCSISGSGRYDGVVDYFMGAGCFSCDGYASSCLPRAMVDQEVRYLCGPSNTTPECLDSYVLQPIKDEGNKCGSDIQFLLLDYNCEDTYDPTDQILAPSDDFSSTGQLRVDAVNITWELLKKGISGTRACVKYTWKCPGTTDELTMKQRVEVKF